MSLLASPPVSHILPVLENGTMMKDELELPGNIFVVLQLDMSLALCFVARISEECDLFLSSNCTWHV